MFANRPGLLEPFRAAGFVEGFDVPEGMVAFDTADFADSAPGNLRADYVLPSRSMRIVGSGVFWPLASDPLFRLVGVFTPTLPGGFPSSDHRMVWVDVTVAGSARGS